MSAEKVLIAIGILISVGACVVLVIQEIRRHLRELRANEDLKELAEDLHEEARKGPLTIEERAREDIMALEDKKCLELLDKASKMKFDELMVDRKKHILDLPRREILPMIESQSILPDDKEPE